MEDALQVYFEACIAHIYDTCCAVCCCSCYRTRPCYVCTGLKVCNKCQVGSLAYVCIQSKSSRNKPLHGLNSEVHVILIARVHVSYRVKKRMLRTAEARGPYDIAGPLRTEETLDELHSCILTCDIHKKEGHVRRAVRVVLQDGRAKLVRSLYERGTPSMYHPHRTINTAVITKWTATSYSTYPRTCVSDYSRSSSSSSSSGS